MLFSDDDENSESSEMDFSDLWDDDVSRKAEKKRMLQEKSVLAKKKQAPEKENDSISTEDLNEAFYHEDLNQEKNAYYKEHTCKDLEDFPLESIDLTGMEDATLGDEDLKLLNKIFNDDKMEEIMLEERDKLEKNRKMTCLLKLSIL